MENEQQQEAAWSHSCAEQPKFLPSEGDRSYPQRGWALPFTISRGGGTPAPEASLVALLGVLTQ